MREDEVYIYTKEWLKFNNFKIIAGQPPKGSDNIPVVEIKSLNNLDKGSKDSFKPDLIAVNSINLFLNKLKFCLANTSSTKMDNINNIKIDKKILNSKLISPFNEVNKIN